MLDHRTQLGSAASQGVVGFALALDGTEQLGVGLAQLPRAQDHPVFEFVLNDMKRLLRHLAGVDVLDDGDKVLLLSALCGLAAHIEADPAGRPFLRT
ncbi:hypothetical protein CEW83_11545 [Parazoarcus communis]|uniref:Uncharacterized protein n=1 Tax=Parazoarcus communis TaxID=41977 RepID=A0A2U8GQK9_9RHOO|nr:hypothetical protein [Parazoarcus communis]AWI75770.1 hypothetical protein CEW83_11545 [Parazoarcus communis]